MCDNFSFPVKRGKLVAVTNPNAEELLDERSELATYSLIVYLCVFIYEPICFSPWLSSIVFLKIPFGETRLIIFYYILEYLNCSPWALFQYLLLCDFVSSNFIFFRQSILNKSVYFFLPYFSNDSLFFFFIISTSHHHSHVVSTDLSLSLSLSFSLPLSLSLSLSLNLLLFLQVDQH